MYCFTACDCVQSMYCTCAVHHVAYSMTSAYVAIVLEPAHQEIGHHLMKSTCLSDNKQINPNAA